MRPLRSLAPAAAGAGMTRGDRVDARTRRRIVWTAAVLALLAAGFYVAFFLVTVAAR